MSITELLQEFFNTILIPAIIAGAAYLLTLIKKYANRYVNSLEVKHELENLAKTAEIKTIILNEIRTIVGEVVGSNMQIADAAKKDNGGHLTDEQSMKIHKTVKDVVMVSLPQSLTEKDGVLLNVVGGSERLEVIIDNMISKAVYDYKIKKVEIKNKL